MRHGRTSTPRRMGLLVLLLALLNACAAIPTGPNVMVLPGVGKPFDLFQAEEAWCRSSAQDQLGVAPEQAATQSAVTSTALGTVVGAAAGAGSGLLVGSASGAQAGTASAATLQARYDRAYVQCMYASGNQVPGVAAAPSPRYVRPPPPPPGPVPPPPSTAPPPPPPGLPRP
jgi:hypothetical protein